MSIPFGKVSTTDLEEKYVLEALRSSFISGDRSYTKKCHKWLETWSGSSKALLTTSGTHALEMSALLLNIQPGDEVIMPSFTFSSTATSFVLRGAQLVFVDVHPETLNMDERCLEAALTPKTRAIVPVHYAGVACDMDPILELGRHKKVAIVEDAAQALMSTYKGRPLGSLGNMGCLSFHETKNISCGEGGALLINDKEVAFRAEIIREKGTNRSQFFRGDIDKYTWTDLGSSYLPSDLLAALLLAQLERAEEITARRLAIWDFYNESFADLEKLNFCKRPLLPAYARGNGHIFYLRMKSPEERDGLIRYLRESGISAVFHYVPLHSSPAGQKFGKFVGEDKHTTRESDRLVRLPLFYDLTEPELQIICGKVHDFFRGLGV